LVAERPDLSPYINNFVGLFLSWGGEQHSLLGEVAVVAGTFGI
jgi:hypothetical protein